MNNIPKPVIEEQQIGNIPSELIKELFSLLAQELPQAHLIINETIGNKEFDAARAQLHKLQGSCVYCGLVRLKEAAVTLDNAIKNNSYSPTLLAVFNEEIQAVMEELKRRGF